MSHYTQYDEQVGCGVGRVYIGAPHQRGSGVGSFLGGVFRYVLPLLKRSAKAVGKEALKAGFNIAADVGERKTPFKEAFKTRMRESRTNLQNKAQDNIEKFMNGEGYKSEYFLRSPHFASVLGKKRKKKRKIRARNKINRTIKKKLKKKKQVKKKKKKKKKTKKLKNSEFVDIFK